MFLLFLLEKEIPMKKLLLLLALVVTQVVFAQYTNFYDEGRIGSQVVNAFCQDADGFLWMATRNGLRRFDGSQFVAYYHSGQDSASLADNEVMCGVPSSRMAFINWMLMGNDFGIYPCPRRCFRCLKTVTGHFGWVWTEEGFTHSTRRRGG